LASSISLYIEASGETTFRRQKMPELVFLLLCLDAAKAPVLHINENSLLIRNAMPILSFHCAISASVRIKVPPGCRLAESRRFLPGFIQNMKPNISSHLFPYSKYQHFVCCGRPFTK